MGPHLLPYLFPLPLSRDAFSQTSYVVMDLGPHFAEGGLLANAIARNSTYQLVGLHTGSPMLRLGTAYFKGELVETIGTDLVFTAEEAPPPPAPSHPSSGQTSGWRRVTSRPAVPSSLPGVLPTQSQRKEANLVGTTTKKIMFSQVKVAMKQPENEEVGGGEAEKDVEAGTDAAGSSQPAKPADDDDVQMLEAGSDNGTEPETVLQPYSSPYANQAAVAKKK